MCVGGWVGGWGGEPLLSLSLPVRDVWWMELGGWVGGWVVDVAFDLDS